MERNIQNGPSVNIDNNGTISWTFPVTLSINIGGGASNTRAASSGQLTPALPAAAVSDTSINTNAATTENEILTKARETFGKRPDVLGVRMGYVFRNGWITKERAIVVTVEKRKSIEQLNKENNSALPRTFMNYPVEITGPTLEQMFQKNVGTKTFESLMLKKPSFLLESRYFPPTGAGVKLEKITDRMKVIAHVSPEQGWSNLSSFLDKTHRSLTIAMDDFGATHIIEKIDELAAKNSFEEFTLTLQPGESVGEGTKANDVKDEEAVEDFENNFGNRFRNAWVHIGSVNGWVNSSYHIKVAVRDNNAIHLSSGNYQSSNQPDIDSLPDKRQNFLLRTYNREWHAIVEHEELAKKYELYIQHDFDNNKEPNVDEMALLEGVSLLVPIDPLLALEAAPQVKAFAPFADDREFTVTPLLIPDNFLKELLPVIESATTELYIQNQTFNAPKDGNAELEQLIDAILKKQQQGVDVKIIFRVIIASTARENIEKLVDRGFDPSSIKTYSKCHTKGVIVDGKTVVLGSQNWSQDGVSVNRDASLLFEDEPLAKYFREIFLHDWNNISKSSIGRESLTMEVARKGAEVPPGMELMTWKELREYL